MPMTPDLTSYGYEILEELGCNREGGRITWKGKLIEREELVVIKQFCFATPNSTWSGYKAYEREIKLLQNLKHQGIPKYLDSLETDNGFCLIQEYIDAISLAELNNITLEIIKIITIRILEILVYLQEREDVIFHCDLKPENILVDRELNPYLIDFGLAKIDQQENSASSIIQGTPGFMAPEQAIAPTKASDLYGLGMTIICLLTNKKSWEILNLARAEDPYRIDLKPLLKQLDSAFVSWLNKMIQPQVKQRFPDALTALKKLQELTWDWQTIELKQEDNLAAVSDSTVSEVVNSISLINQLLKLLSKIPLSPFSLGTMMIGTLVTAITLGINICDRVIDKSFFNLTIAAIGILIVYLSQSAAAISYETDKSSSKETIAFAIAFPLVLVMIAGIVLGWGEAVAMTLSVIIAQVLNLGYLLLQTISFQLQNHKLQVLSLFLAVFLGILFGNIITP